MEKSSKTGLFIFRRDLRITDNIGLLEACSQCSRLYTCFIFTPEQVGKSNTYRSENAIRFMIESLEELSESLKRVGGELFVFYGKNKTVLKDVINVLKIDSVFFNRDYSPYARKRDSEINQLCSKMGVECITSADYYLYEPGTIMNGTGGYYKKYTPFYKHVLDIPVAKPQKGEPKCLSKYSGNIPHSITLADSRKTFVKTENSNVMVHGGRKAALSRLLDGLKSQAHYDDTRDFLKNETTGLSAHIKFGCISIREIYHAFLQKYGLHFGLLRELIWREFFAHVLYNFPEVLEDSYQPKFRHIPWLKSTDGPKDGPKDHFQKWCRGETGFPVVDACMRQLNATGYMHNRGRMIVANFLIKTLLYDWHLGEKYFAQKLTDYDPASNNGNWQGISGTGVDMKPYYRDMNPWIQSAKFDRDTVFIKKWVPELADVASKDIHHWAESSKSPKYSSIKYPQPIVDYDVQKVKMLALYKNNIG